jgi:hypothetical protein
VSPWATIAVQPPTDPQAAASGPPPDDTGAVGESDYCGSSSSPVRGIRHPGGFPIFVRFEQSDRVASLGDCIDHRILPNSRPSYGEFNIACASSRRWLCQSPFLDGQTCRDLRILPILETLLAIAGGKMNIENFFTDLVAHFRSRQEFVRSLAVMAANEHWFQMEAAALLDLGREHYGIGGGSAKEPDWWVTCEHKKIDLWIQDSAGQKCFAVELKSIHNNKNFDKKILEVRRDLSSDKGASSVDGNIERYAIIIATFASYKKGSEGNFQRNQKLDFDLFEEQITAALRESGSHGLPPAKLTPWEKVCSLDSARYIDEEANCGVWLGLARSAKSTKSSRAV